MIWAFLALVIGVKAYLIAWIVLRFVVLLAGRNAEATPWRQFVLSNFPRVQRPAQNRAMTAALIYGAIVVALILFLRAAGGPVLDGNLLPDNLNDNTKGIINILSFGL